MTVPVFLFEPVASIKRRKFAEIVSNPKKPALPPVEETRQHLRYVRQYSLENLEVLVKRLQDSLSQKSQTKFVLAENAGQAVEYIDQICGSTKTLAVNNSAVVTKELVPVLKARGFNIADSYHQQFPSFQNQFRDYWQLPAIDFNVLHTSFSPPIDLNQLRQKELTQNGARDFIALIGVGAASASDGSLFMVQHGHNITDICLKAKTLVIVIGLDKITAETEEALFQARCMALFGAEARLLDLQSPVKEGPTIDEIPVLPARPAAEEVHIILLDNGRLRILNGQFKQLLTCINCRACLKGCPTYKYFGGPYHWSPKEYIYYFVLGQNSSLDLCLQCGLCRSHCPIEIDIPGLIATARAEKRQHFIDRILTNVEIVGKTAAIAPFLVNGPLSSRSLRFLADTALGLSKNRKLPRFHRHSFVSQRETRKGAGPR